MIQMRKAGMWGEVVALGLVNSDRTADISKIQTGAEVVMAEGWTTTRPDLLQRPRCTQQTPETQGGTTEVDGYVRRPSTGQEGGRQGGVRQLPPCSGSGMPRL